MIFVETLNDIYHHAKPKTIGATFVTLIKVSFCNLLEINPLEIYQRSENVDTLYNVDESRAAGEGPVRGSGEGGNGDCHNIGTPLWCARAVLFRDLRCKWACSFSLSAGRQERDTRGGRRLLGTRGRVAVVSVST